MPAEIYTQREMMGQSRRPPQGGNQSPAARLSEMQQLARRKPPMTMEEALRFIRNQRKTRIPRQGGIPGQTARPFRAVKAPPTGRIPTFKPDIAAPRNGKTAIRGQISKIPEMLVTRTINQLLFLFTGQPRLARILQAKPQVKKIRIEIINRAIARVQKKQFPAITPQDVNALYKAVS